MQEGDNLPAGTGSGGREVTATRSAGDFILYCPSHSLRIVRAGGNIVKLSIGVFVPMIHFYNTYTINTSVLTVNSVIS